MQKRLPTPQSSKTVEQSFHGDSGRGKIIDAVEFMASEGLPFPAVSKESNENSPLTKSVAVMLNLPATLYLFCNLNVISSSFIFNLKSSWLHLFGSENKTGLQ